MGALGPTTVVVTQANGETGSATFTVVAAPGVQRVAGISMGPGAAEVTRFGSRITRAYEGGEAVSWSATKQAQHCPTTCAIHLSSKPVMADMAGANGAAAQAATVGLHRTMYTGMPDRPNMRATIRHEYENDPGADHTLVDPAYAAFYHQAIAPVNATRKYPIIVVPTIMGFSTVKKADGTYPFGDPHLWIPSKANYDELGVDVYSPAALAAAIALAISLGVPWGAPEYGYVANSGAAGSDPQVTARINADQVVISKTTGFGVPRSLIWWEASTNTLAPDPVATALWIKTVAAYV